VPQRLPFGSLRKQTRYGNVETVERLEDAEGELVENTRQHLKEEMRPGSYSAPPSSSASGRHLRPKDMSVRSHSSFSARDSLRISLPESDSFPLACRIVPRSAYQPFLHIASTCSCIFESTCQLVRRVHFHFQGKALNYETSNWTCKLQVN